MADVDFYTNVYQSRNNILIRGYLNGERYKEIVPYKPYVFLPSKDNRETEYQTIYGERVYKKEFKSIKAARDFIRSYETVDEFKFYGLTRFVYTCINDKYPGEIHYDPSVVKVWNLDIETDSSEFYGDPEKGDTAITLIGVGVGKYRVVFGCGDYETDNKFHIYVRCKDEHDLLRKFVAFWANESEGPDIVTGWNIEAYDIPFIVNRIANQLGMEEAKKLSPWGIVEEKILEGKWGREVKTYTIAGVSVLDYYLLYRKFTYTQLESYTLDHVAFVETGKKKLDYSEYESLNQLYKQNYRKFVDYNITDIDRVADIDDKNKFIELVMAIAYDAKVNLVDALTSVLLWDVIGHNYLMERKKVIPQHLNNEQVSIPGAYVKEPKLGLHEWVVCFDFTSLYPKLINLLNISPETLCGFQEWGIHEFEKVLNRGFDPSELQRKNETQAANGARYRKDKHGFLPELMTHGFNIRAEAKKKMLAAKRENEVNPSPELEKQIARYKNLQQAKKIQLNSLYGSLANPGYRFYDFRNSSAITLSGQLAVKFIEKTINELMGEKFGKKDYVIAIDTDSVYIDCSSFMVDCKCDAVESVNFLDGIMKTVVQPAIDKALNDLAYLLNAYEPALEMKREAIADKAIWRGKKMYIMNVLNSEGVQYEEPELKMMGIEAIRSSTPIVCRDAIKETLKLIISGTNEDVINYIDEFRRKYAELPFEDIAFPRGINGIDQYSDPVLGWKKGTPIHVRGAVVYNKLIMKKGLEHKYPLISDKEKVKFCYLSMPNPVHSNVIAVPKILPKELGIDGYIDRTTQFEKTYLGPIKSFLVVIGWEWERNQTLDSLLKG